MPIFEYRGINKMGKSARGRLDVENSRMAKLHLKKQGIYVTDLRNKAQERRAAKGSSVISKKKVGVRDLSMMTRQLATLLKANIPLVDSLSAVSEQIENRVLAEAMAEIKNMVNEGAPLYKSLQKYPNIFNKIYVSLCEAGETSGTLDVILIRLAEFTESQSELSSKVKSAMTYPVILVVLSMGILTFLFVNVIPKIVAVFESTPELTLPWFTLALIDVSDFISAYWILILVSAVLSYFIFQNWKRSPSGQVRWDQLVLKTPVVGRLSRLIAVSRFSQTLATLLNGGVPMISSMNIVRNVVDNEILARAIDNARDNISEGESIAGPLKKSQQFPPLLIHMINIGEKTGDLETMLTQVSDSYDFQVNNQVESLTAILAPAMIVLMGCIIMIIVFAILIPIFDLMNLGG